MSLHAFFSPPLINVLESCALLIELKLVFKNFSTPSNRPEILCQSSTNQF